MPKLVVIASANGNQFENGGAETCVEHAFRPMTESAPRDPLEALVEGVTIVERDPDPDPDETSVALGSLPNADGMLQLDACCMDGPPAGGAGRAGLRPRLRFPGR